MAQAAQQGIRDIEGVKVDLDRRLVVDGTLPVNERYYYGSRVSPRTKCYEYGKYCNVELFQPVIYDKECKIPSFDAKWIEWDNPNIKARRMLRINYPHSYKEWWYEQRRRCIEGYTVGGVYITGEYYFYLNFWRIRGKKRGAGFISPKFFDFQKEIFDLVARARAEGKNLLTLKRRQVGFSECYAAMIAHEYTFYPMARGLIVAGEDKYATKTMENVVGGLDALLTLSAGREFYKRRGTKNKEDKIECGWESKTGGTMGYLGQVEAITTKDNEQAANGKTPSFCLLEEAGINPLLDKVYGMIRPAIEEQGLQDGRIIIINGTGGNMEAGAKLLQNMFYNPKEYNILVSDEVYEEGVTGTAHFFPAWKWYVIDNDGNSYKEQGLVLLREQRRLTKTNITELKTQFPFVPSEAFTLSGNCPFNVAKLENQYKRLRDIDADSLIQWGRLEWIFDNRDKVDSESNDNKLLGMMVKRKPIGVRWVACPQGCEKELDHDGDLLYPVSIIEHPDMPGGREDFTVLFSDPRYETLYKAGMDPYNKDEASKSAYSQGSVAICKGYLHSGCSYFIFPATMTWRPLKKEKFYEMSVMLCCYYGMARVLIEWSNDSPMDWFKNNGWEFLLKERPLITQAEMIDSGTVNRYGVDPNTKHVWEERYAQYIEDYYHHMLNPRQVEKALGYRKRKGFNCDESIAYMLAWEHLQDDIHLGVKVRNNKEKSKTKTLTPMGMGYIMDGGTIRAIS